MRLTRSHILLLALVSTNRVVITYMYNRLALMVWITTNTPAETGRQSLSMSREARASAIGDVGERRGQVEDLAELDLALEHQVDQHAGLRGNHHWPSSSTPPGPPAQPSWRRDARVG